jgi:glycogen operon protein
VPPRVACLGLFRRRRYYQGRRIRGSDDRDLTWLRPDGMEMTDAEWGARWNRVLGVMLAGDALAEVDERGDLIEDDTLLLLMNAHVESMPFRLPTPNGGRWELLIDTARPDVPEAGEAHDGGATVRLEARSLQLLRLPNGDAEL